MVKKILYTAGGLMINAANIFAQTGTAADEKTSVFNQAYYDTVALLIIGVVVLIVIGFLYFGQGAEKESPEKAASEVWSKIKHFLNRSTPIEKEKDIMLDHDFDGIHELDNRIPPWFSYLFYATIIFAIYYMLYFHVFNSGPLQEEEYKQEMMIAALHRAELERSGALVNEETVTFLNDEAALSEGKSIYDANCVACHGPQGGGIVGPNLTDNYWIHGGGIKDVFKTVKYGVPAKGMVAWETQLNAKQIQAVASYVITLIGTNPPNPKQPEGTLYEPADTTAASN